jgi:hypothetical protein
LNCGKPQSSGRAGVPLEPPPARKASVNGIPAQFRFFIKNLPVGPMLQHHIEI